MRVLDGRSLPAGDPDRSFVRKFWYDGRVELGRETGRIAAVDYGRARIGVAVSDELFLMAHVRPYVPALPPARALRQLRALFQAEGVTLVVVGLPRNMDGSEGLSARRARKFAQELEGVCGLPIEFVDERWSTVEAQARLRQAGESSRDTRGRIDSASAAILLQSFLDARSQR